MREQKTATACTSSVGADERQLPQQNCNISIPIIAPDGKQTIEPLRTTDGQTLLLSDLPPTRFVVDGLLPQGLFILAGSPKIGKSWLALLLSQTVAAGGHLWGRGAEQGGVLYLALEDSLTRLQQRYKKYAANGAPALHFTVHARTIRDGLTAQVDHFIAQHPDTRLVIIDTMQHIRGNSTDKNCYANDYNDMNTLREITNRHDVALLLVTHTRKMDDSDPLNRVSGSTGLVGAADGVFILEKEERSANKGRLTVENRDTEGHVFQLEFDRLACRWELLEEVIAEDKEDPLLPFLLALLAGRERWEGTATALCEAAQEYGVAASYSPATIVKHIKRNEQLLLLKYKIEARFQTVKNSKTIILRKILLQ